MFVFVYFYNFIKYSNLCISIKIVKGLSSLPLSQVVNISGRSRTFSVEAKEGAKALGRMEMLDHFIEVVFILTTYHLEIP